MDSEGTTEAKHRDLTCTPLIFIFNPSKPQICTGFQYQRPRDGLHAEKIPSPLESDMPLK